MHLPMDRQRRRMAFHEYVTGPRAIITRFIDMKKVLLFAFAVFTAFSVSAQVPSITTSSKLKFIEGDNTWLATVADLSALITAGSGTVTSVDVSGGTTGLTTSGGAVTTSGTITIAGTLDADNGGTGQSSYTTGDILYASSSSALSKLNDVATGNALISGGTSTAPSWGKIGLSTHVSGTLAIGNGGTGLTSVGGDGTILGSDGAAALYLNPTITTTAAAIAFARSGSNLNLNIPNADASNRGTVSTTTQTFAGAKTFNALVTGGSGVTSTASASNAALFATGVTGGTITTITATSTADETYNMIEVGTISADITLNLPACNATRNGWIYDVVKTGTDTHAVVIDPNGSEAFYDSATTKSIYSQGNSASCKCKWNGSSGSWIYKTN